MRQMKYSGIEWIGDIPEEWQLDKGKAIFRQRNERGNNIELQILSPSQKLGVVPQSLLEERTGQKIFSIIPPVRKRKSAPSSSCLARNVKESLNTAFSRS